LCLYIAAALRAAWGDDAPVSRQLLRRVLELAVDGDFPDADEADDTGNNTSPGAGGGGGGAGVAGR
jgi:hypothetical protein